MLNGKFLITLVAIIVAIFAISTQSNITEHFWGNPSRTFKVDRQIKNKLGNFVSQPGVYHNLLNESNLKKGDFFQVPGTFQAPLSPRMGNVDYGANIRYNAPSQKHLAVPKNPLSMGNMVKENYDTDSYGIAKCNKDGSSQSVPHSRKAAKMAANYADKSYHELRDKLKYTDVTDVLPVEDMTSVNALGKEVAPIVYDRFMYANQKSKLHGRGDYIRGDLPITPCNSGWFQVSVHPNIDLNGGAMSVLGGLDNGTSKALHELQNISSGGVQTVMGGVDYSSVENMAVSKFGVLGAGHNDVSLSAFP